MAKDNAKAEVKEQVEGLPEPYISNRDLTVEVVLHDARHIDVRLGNEIRRVKNHELAAKHNKLGEKILLEESTWLAAGHAPYAKPKKK